MDPSRGYYDLQLNGYAGVDFNTDNLTADQLHRACAALERDGVAGCLGTIITEEVGAMCRRVQTLCRLRETDELARQVIDGIHIEGPFLSPKPGYAGAHPIDAICPADVETTRKLLEAGGGLVRLFTLAPEHDAGFAVTKFLSGQGVVVSGGHCDPSLDEIRASIDAGLSMFTHLGNGCPSTLHRHDNIVQRVIHVAQETPLWCCFIADGVHIPAFALRNYLRAVGLARSIVVTDGTAPSGLGPGTYTIGRWTVTVGEDLVSRSPDGSHFLGSAMTMPDCERILTTKLNLSKAEVEQLTSANPRRAVGEKVASKFSSRQLST